MADPFHFTDGKSANTIAELTAVIESSDKRVFEDHVNAQRNDFANWIEYSLHEKALADDLRRTTDRIATISLLRTHVRKQGITAQPMTQPKAAPAAVAPPLQHHFLEQGHQREFLFGLAVGIIIGVLLLRIVQVLA